MRNLLRIAVLATVLAGMAALPPAPAHAATAASALVTGTITTGPLGWPVLHAPNLTGFSMGTKSCAGVKTDALSETKFDGSYGPLCSMQATGVLVGNCGAMTGTGTGIITFFPQMTKTASFNFTFNVYGTTMEMTGASTKGTFAGSVELAEDPTTGSCLAGDQTGFLFVGGVSITTP